MNCPHCSAPLMDNAKFCIRCGRPVQTPDVIPPVSAPLVQSEPIVTPPAPISETVSAPVTQPVPEASSAPQPPSFLSEPVPVAEDGLHKEFGELITPRKRPRVGMGYLTALMSLAALAVLFLPLFAAQTLFGIETNGSLFSALTILFRADIGNVLQSLLSYTGVTLVPGLDANSLMLVAKIGLSILFVLPLLNLALSFLTRGSTRFYLMLVTTLLGGALFSVMRTVIQSTIEHMGRVAQDLVPQNIPAVTLSIIFYFLTLVYAFFGCVRKKAPKKQTENLETAPAQKQ